jgi:hypothetical protein
MTVKSRMEKLPPPVDWDSLPLLLDEGKAALALGVSVSFLRKARGEGIGKGTLDSRGGENNAPPFVRLGGRVKYPTRDLREWAESLPRRRVI